MSSKSVAIVTGGANGLGASIAKSLLADGHSVAIWDVAKPDLSMFEGNCIYCQCDVTSTENIEMALLKTVEVLGSVSILVNNAGVIHSEPFINLFAKQKRHSLLNWQKVMTLNLNSVFEVTSHVAEHMVSKRKKGIIVNISSISARGNAGQVAYSAAKAGVEAMSNVWAKELGPMGIRSVSIAPGFIETESTKCALSDSQLETIKRETPLNKLGQHSNIASTVLHVINNDFITGTTIAIDGAYTV